MTAKKGSGGTWRQVAVVLREDILAQAQASGLDINDLCNRALAGATGIAYPPKKSPGTVPATPVIIAHDGGPAGSALVPPAQSAEIPPVINADDPRAATVVKQAPVPLPQKKTTALPGRISSPGKVHDILPVPVDTHTPALPVPSRKPAGKQEKKGKGTLVRKFITEALIREDNDEGHITKDALYQAFSQWCREHRITPVPDRKTLTVALKNQFAVKEKTVEGEPSWTGIRLR